MKLIEKMINRVFKNFNYKQYVKRIGVQYGQEVKFIGKNINFGSEPYLIEIGNHVTISSNVSFITHDGGTFVFREDNNYKDVIKYGRIKIGNNVFIGINSIILPGVKIGNNVLIGAGSIVTKNVENNSVYVGVPAKKICTIEEYKEKCKKECPIYDIDNYRKRKKDEILKVYKS